MSNAQNRKALLIGVGNYKDKEITALSSADDVRMLEEVWRKQYFDVIPPLVNDNATKKNIVGALESLAKKVQNGDIIVIHYSGHGVQIPDNNGDEIDCLDEALAPYDAPQKPKNNDDYAKYLRDDELDMLLNAIQKKIGRSGLLLVFLDSCHSGSGTRGEDSEVVERHIPFYGKKPENCKSDSYKIPFLDRNSDASRRIVYTAVSPEQKSYELPGGGGKLSYAIRNAFVFMNSKATNNSFFASISGYIKAHEHRNGETPTLTGNWSNFLNSPFLDNKYSAISRFDLIFAKKIWDGVVNGRSTESQSEKIQGSFEEDMTLKIEEFIRSNTSDFLKVKVALDKKIPNAQRVKLEGEINSSKVVKISKTPDIILRVENGNVIIDDVKCRCNYDTTNILNYKSLLNKYFYYKWFMQTDVFNKDMDVEMILKKADWDPNSIDATLTNVKVNTESDFETDSSGFSIMTSKDNGVLRIRNKKPVDLYFCLLDIMPDGKINQILPDTAIGFTKNTLRIKGKSEIVVPLGHPSSPWGIENYLLVTAKVPLDLEYFINKDKTMLPEGEENTSRGGKMISTDFATFKFTYRIKL